MQVLSGINLFTNPINIASGNSGAFTTVTPAIAVITIGKRYRQTFHLNAYYKDTENTQATLTLSGTDVVTSITHLFQDEATNTVRLTFDTFFNPINI